MADLMANGAGDALSLEFLGADRLRVTTRPADGGEGRSREYVAREAAEGLVAACRSVVAYGPAHRGAYCDNYDCMYCEAAIDEGESHKGDCAYELARAALAAAGEG